MVISGAIESLATAMLAYLPKKIFDSLLVKTNVEYILLIIGEFCLCSLICILAGYLSMIFNWKLSVIFENRIKKDFFISLIKKDDIDFYKKDVSEYVSIQANDIMQIEQDYLTPLIASVNQIIKVIILAVVMFFGINHMLAIIIFAGSLFTAILPKYTGKDASSKRLTFVNNLSKYTDMIYDFLNGFRFCNSRTFEKITGKHHSLLDETSHSRYKYGKAKSLSLVINYSARVGIQLLGIISIILLLVNHKISIGSAVATFGFIDSFVDPLEEILYDFTTMETVRDVKNKVFSMLQYEKEDDKLIKKKFDTKIEIKNLTVNRDTFKLNNISLEFEKNKHYAIIGSNGSGKSTFLNTIMGYVSIDSGDILIDSKDISKYDLSWIIFYLVQKSHIFSSDYFDNVTMFKAYDDNSLNVLHEIGISEDIISKIQNKETSTLLSGGEQQIISYLRARNSKTPILIMDEPFSAVDKHSKELLLKDISRLKDKTIIMITHDINEALNQFDRVFKFNNGSVEEYSYTK